MSEVSSASIVTDAIHLDPSACLQYALAYAEAGYKVFPLRPRSKEPLVQGGFKAATDNTEQILTWWKKWPDANVGIATGAASGLLVVDIDSSEGRKLFQSLGALPVLPPAVDTGKGRHVYFGLPPDCGSIKCSAGGGLDIRADGGYVVAPPSIHPNGNAYKWRSDGPEAPVVAPGWLMDWARSRKTDVPGAAAKARERNGKAAGARSLVARLKGTLKSPDPYSEAAEARLRSALAVIPASERDVWLRVGFALHDLTRGDPAWAVPARRLWDEWSVTCPENYSRDGQEKAWASFERDLDGRPVTIGTILGWARDAGWVDPASTTALRLSGAETPASDVTPAIEPATGVDLAHYARNDVGNQEIFRAMFGKNLFYVQEWGCWLAWDTTRWVPISDLAAMPLAVRCAKEIEKLAFAMPHSNEEREKSIKHALATQKLERLKSMLSLAKSYLLIEPEKLDRNEALLGCPNGTVELRTETLRAARREDLITKQTAVPYDPAAGCPQFLAFLDWALQHDAETVEYFRRIIGYSTTGSAREEILVALVGGGNNGKTTLLTILSSSLGDYAGRAPSDLLVSAQGKEDAPTPALVALQGKRLVVVSETSDGARLSEAQVKLITSNHDIPARQLREKLFNFPATHQTILDTNHKPKVHGTDEGIWRRLRIITFEAKLEPGTVRTDFREKVLEPEKPGILRWAVGGAAAWYRTGLGNSKKVERDTAGYRSEMDTVKQFIEERCELDPSAVPTLAAVYQGYLSYCQVEFILKPFGKRRFKDELERCGHPTSEGAGHVRVVRGLRMRSGLVGLPSRPPAHLVKK